MLSRLLPATLLLGVLAPFATAQTKNFTVELIGGQQVPPVVTGGSGTVTVRLDPSTGAVSVSGRYMNLRGNATAAHIHGSSIRGVNAGVILPLTVGGGVRGTITGSGSLTPTQTRDLIDGHLYLNLHSTMHPSGELRGQIDSVPGSGTAPGSRGIVVTGHATPGGTLVMGCPPTSNRAFVMIGLALPSCQTVSIPTPLACRAPTELALDLAVEPLIVGRRATSVTIPNGLPPFHVALQCLEIVTNCITLSGAVRVSIR